MIALFASENEKLEKELNVWASFYLIFNDDNKLHCEQALENLLATGEIKETPSSMRRANLRCVEEIRNQGTRPAEIIALMPEAKEYMNVKAVDKKWLWRRAKAIESECLKRHGHSLATISIEHYLNSCILDIHIDEDVVEIDYDCYKSAREKILSDQKPN